MTPDLQRIPPDGDAVAKEIITLARAGVTAELLGCLVSLARHHYVARQPGLDPGEVFAAAVRGLPDEEVAGLFRVFGAREDVTLESFGWLLVQGGDGPAFERKDPVPAGRLRALVLEAGQRRHRYLEARFGAADAEQVERSNRKLFGTDRGDGRRRRLTQGSADPLHVLPAP